MAGLEITKALLTGFGLVAAGVCVIGALSIMKEMFLESRMKKQKIPVKTRKGIKVKK